MKRIILATVIAAPAVRYFADPPAVDAAPPASDTPPPSGTPPDDSSILDFSAPDIDLTAADLSGKPAPTEKPTPTEKKDTPPPKPGEKPAPEPPAKQLRVELDAVKAERDQLKQTLEKGDPRIAQAEAAVKAKETELKERDDRIKEYERKIALADPRVTKELAELDSAQDKAWRQFSVRVPQVTLPVLRDLTVKFHQLPVGKPGYEEALASFEAEVNRIVGGQDGVDHRRLQPTLDFIQQYHEFSVKRPELEKAVNQSALQRHRAALDEDFSGSTKFVRENLEKAKGIPEGLKERDPFHPKVMLDIFESSMTPEHLAAVRKGLPEFVELVFAGPKPFNPEEYAGQTDEQIKEAKATQAQRYEAARAQAVDVTYNGLRALRIIPALVKELQRLRERVKDDNHENPPDPTKGPNDGSPGGGNDDLKDFRPPNLDDLGIR